MKTSHTIHTLRALQSQEKSADVISRQLSVSKHSLMMNFAIIFCFYQSWLLIAFKINKKETGQFSSEEEG